ncbi:MAG: aspartyl protease family protein [Anaerolineae bacterium]|nr:aspartyl protease family protein [Anaerolineae bacterium]
MGELKLIIQPDADEVETAEVLVDGRVGGRAYRFLLDTGAARTNLLWDDYTAAFERSGTNASSGVFAPATDDLITVPSIEVGSIARRDFTVARSADRQPGVRNLIGMDLLKDYRLHFLFDRNRVLVNPEDAGETGYRWQDVRFDSRFHPYVDVSLGAAVARAVWDTGASITVVDTNFIERHPAYFQAAGQSTGTDSTGAQVETPMFVMAATVIGGCAFPPRRVAGVDLSPVNGSLEIPMDLILGYSTIYKANWLFDFPRRRWAITKQPGDR